METTLKERMNVRLQLEDVSNQPNIIGCIESEQIKENTV